MRYQFHRSLVGGTFDRFHSGHQKLLTAAFEQSEKVIIGIATDELFQNKHLADLIENYPSREQSVKQFVSEKGFVDRYEIVPIHDFYGTSLTDKNLDAIFITESNKENVQKMNKARQEKGFSPLEIIIVPYVSGDDGNIISSERIRKGEIDREGNAYIQIFEAQDQFVLPQHEREALRSPIGTIETDIKDLISSFSPSTVVIAVGDVVAATLAQSNRQADISIIDGRTRREHFDQDMAAFYPDTQHRKTDNPAGIITRKGALSIKAAITDFKVSHKKQLLIVSGEEDLLAIPAILLSSDQTVVLYGQFGIGVVVVKVSEQSKKRVYDLFRKFQ